MKVVIIGATGLIGKAVTALLMDKGHEIVQASRNTQPGLILDIPPPSKHSTKHWARSTPWFEQHQKGTVVLARSLFYIRVDALPV
jgi:NAD dependent epimerase/dehydratase family enzyme